MVFAGDDASVAAAGFVTTKSSTKATRRFVGDSAVVAKTSTDPSPRVTAASPRIVEPIVWVSVRSGGHRPRTDTWSRPPRRVLSLSRANSSGARFALSRDMVSELAPDQRPTSAPDRFRPAHCPNPACTAHLATPGTYRHHIEYIKDGGYRRKAPPFRIERFACKLCGVTYSTQTFSPTYYMKRPEILVPAARLLTNGEADRHVRRSLAPNPRYAPRPNAGCAGSTVTRLVPRLAREAMLFLNELESGSSIDEPLAVDDFVTFAHVQLNQVSLPTVIGRATSYVYHIDQAPHRRGGKLTGAQRAAERTLVRQRRFPRDARRRAWRRVIETLLDRTGPDATLSCVSDGDPIITEVLASAASRVRHTAHPNPVRGPKGSARSKDVLIRDRAMFEVDHFHRWMRHSQAHDRRETIAFAQSVNALLGRRILFAVARNAIQARRERKDDGPTPAMLRGLIDRALSWDEILERRRFPRRTAALHPGWDACYAETIPTLGRKPSKRRFPLFAR